METLEICFEDEHLVAVNKPPGLLVHPSPIDKSETRFAIRILENQLGQKVYPVHRLDKPTSGLLLMAKSSAVARSLSEKFQSREVKKTYVAFVRGRFKEEILLDYALKEELDDVADFQAKPDKAPQDAKTFFKPLWEVELPYSVDKFPTARYSLVMAQPLTGRKHQIRRHLRHLGHPIIGDVNHGVGKHNRFFAEHFKVKRLLLACIEVEFNHPVSKKNLMIKAGLEAHFRQLLKTLGCHDLF